MASALLLAAKGRELPVPTWVFGVGAFLALCLLLVITFQFNKDR